VSNVRELWEVIFMGQNSQGWCATAAAALIFISSGLAWAQDTDPALRDRLMLPELIEEVLARNP
jgi:hypothetical protein